MKEVVIFDLDGTLADHEHRMHHIQKERSRDKNWGLFFKEVVDDEPIRPVIGKLQKFMKRPNTLVIIMTGRSSVCYHETVFWLKAHKAVPHALMMREAGDRRPDLEVKAEMHKDLEDAIGEFKVLRVYEDRQRMVDMWRNDYGYDVVQIKNYGR